MKGIGSLYILENYVWLIVLVMEGMIIKDKVEKEWILDLLVVIDVGIYLMYEGFDVDNFENYIREWFLWVNMMFCELVMDYFDIWVEK